MDVTLDAIKGVMVEKFGVEADTVRPDTQLEELGMDSLATLEFMYAFEEKYGIKFEDTREEINTIGDLVTLVERLKQSAQP
jgi:acyl carrier protein